MNSNVLSKFDEILKDFDNLSIHNIERLVHESLTFFEYLRGKLNSPDEAERTQATLIAKELQKKLEQQAEKAFMATGMNRDQLNNFLRTPTNFSQEEWSVLQKAEQELSSYQAEVFKGMASNGPGSNESSKKQALDPALASSKGQNKPKREKTTKFHG